MEICCDAVSYQEKDVNFMTALSCLVPNDVKKFYFLCLDHMSKDCPKTAEEFFLLWNISENDKYNLLKELLFYIKKYKLLIMLNTCRHQMETNLKKGSAIIDSGRLILYNLCEDLRNSDIEVLKTVLNIKDVPTNPEWRNVAGEEFFCFWLREITREKIKELQNALKSIKYKEIRKFENEFISYFGKNLF
ncbi:uncharacterized protein LOC111612964 [Centruroides sculpturatus]|uniref:uncharacterized protein LOC111612964 n=1 Tax=Centruroides sculpturatus TaxID=218467 RepID=UPI000C6D396A|nr:uncharacterized protein LOC111612964 [Centruroides sculpturatus]XP_023210027.1 uncharacterized protein LOC111612964 [Centruroides sculpturatus]